MSIANLRKDYQLASLSETDVAADPIEQFAHWFEQALKADALLLALSSHTHRGQTVHGLAWLDAEFARHAGDPVGFLVPRVGDARDARCYGNDFHACTSLVMMDAISSPVVALRSAWRKSS